MKRYLGFILLLIVFSIQSQGANSCRISSFLDNSGDITEVVYNTPFKIDIVIHYDASTPADKLLVNIQLPANNTNYFKGEIIPSVTTPVKVATFGITNNILTVVLTDFSATPDFTLHLLKVYLSPNSICNATTFQYGVSMQSSLLDVVNNESTSLLTSSILGKHKIGIINTYLNGTYGYNNTANAKNPLYMDFYINILQGTYISNNIFFSLTANSNLTIKTVVYKETILTPNANGKYQLATLYNPATNYNSYYDNSFLRVYFDINNSSTQPFAINLGVNAAFDIPGCEAISGNTFNSTVSSVSQVDYKNDDLLLQYPSIYGDNNYTTDDRAYSPCTSDFSLKFNLDNIYNQAMLNLQTPVVTTFDNAQNLTIKKLTFDSDMIPVVYVKYTNSEYQLASFDAGTTNEITFLNSAISSIKMEYRNVLSQRSHVVMNVLPSGSTSSIRYNLLKDNNSYQTVTNTILSQSSPNYAYSIQGKQFVGIGEVVSNTFYYFIYNTLSLTDYAEYILNSSMVFNTVDLGLLFSLDNNNWKTLDEFNNIYASGNPHKMEYEIIGQKIRFKYIPIKGYYETCINSGYVFYVKLNTKVIDRPTTIDNNINYSYYTTENSTQQNGTITRYIWSIDVTENIKPSVALSCDANTFLTNLTIKSNDAFSVKYLLENIVPHKYSNVSPTIDIRVVKPNTFPAVSLVQIHGTSQIPLTAYTISYATNNCSNSETSFCSDLVFTSTSTSSSNVMRITITNPIVFDFYDQLILTASYSSGLGLSGSTPAMFTAKIGNLTPTDKASKITVGPKSDCDLFDCQECITSFSPSAGKEYLLSAWVKETYSGTAPLEYAHSGIRLSFKVGNDDITPFALVRPSGPIVDGWQRIEYAFTIPATASDIHIKLVNESAATGADVFFDDIRIHPYNSNMKSFVYDPSTQKLLAELDENNFATLYEYDDEGILIRVKKETERGVMTIKETRSNQSKITK